MSRWFGAQKDVADVLDELHDRGYEISENGSGHLRIERDGKIVACCSHTPTSPYRAVTNIRADIRRWERNNGYLAPQEATDGAPRSKRPQIADGMSVAIQPE